jgi:hypothetical protein
MSERHINLNQSGATIGVGYSEHVEANHVGGTIHNYAQEQNLVKAALEIQKLVTQLQTQGYDPKDAQQKVASDLAIQAKNDSKAKSELVRLGQYLGDAAANGIIGDIAVEVFKLALRLAGIPML